jgi:hypothetical protein
VQQQAKDFPARHDMMKIKMTVMKCHAFGTFVDIKFNELEVMGANLTIENIFETIFHYMEKTNQSSLRNVYIQLDNVYSNKGYIILICLAILIRLGIVKKIKIGYLLVGHTHDDIDGLIGVIASALRQLDVMSLSELVKAIRRAVHKESAEVKEVLLWYGLPDYESVFSEVHVSNRIPLTTMRQASIQSIIIYYLCHECLYYR